MGNISDIIQRILIEGDREVTSTFKRVGDAGVSAFSAIENVVTRISSRFAQFQADLEKTNGAAQQFKTGIGQVGSAVGTFVTRVTGAGAVLSALGAHMLSGVLGISTSLRTIRESSIASQLAIRQEASARKQSVIQTFEQSNALEDLRRKFSEQIKTIGDTRDAFEDLDRQLASGAINRKQYADQLAEIQFQQNRARRKAFEERQKEETELRFQQERARSQAIQLQAEQEDLRKEQAKDAAAQQRRLVAIQLEATYGGALSATLINLAGILEQVRGKFIAAFGPQLSEFLLNVGNTINNNSTVIIGYFKTIGDAVINAFKKSGASLDDIVKGVVKFGADLVNVVTTIIIPAFQFVLSVINSVLSAINSLFGTNFTASAVIATLIIFKFAGVFGQLAAGVRLASGAVTLLFAAFGPVGFIVRALALLILTVLLPALAKLDWTSFGAKALEVWNSILKTISDAATAIETKWNSTFTWFGDRLHDLANWWQGVIDKVRAYLGLTKSDSENFTPGQFPLNDISGFAGGGLFRGRGGIDQNLIRVTDKEYIVNPKAVRHWGVGFFDMLNAMVNPLRGFAKGGFTGLSTPMPQVRFAPAGAGSRGVSRPLTLVIGDQPFEGLTVEDNTAENIGRYAARRGIRSAGRRPLWFGGSR